MLMCFFSGGVGLQAAGSADPAVAQGQSRERQDSDSRATVESSTVASVERGATVRLSGEVIRVVDRDEFRLSDGTGSIPVRIAWTGPAPVVVGDRVQVEGLVVDEMTFGLSRPELVATSLVLRDGAIIRFGNPSARPAAPDATAESGRPTPIGQLARGQSAVISGHVTDIVDVDEFRLADSSGSVRVYVGSQKRVAVGVGDLVTVTGMLDDDPSPIAAEFYADTLVLPDGAVTDLRVGEAARLAPVAQTPPSTPTGKPSRIADLRPYDAVLLQGVVERITDEDEFRLRDDSGSIGVYIGWRNSMPVAAGDEVTVVGIVDAEGSAGLPHEVYAFEITAKDGTQFKLQPRRNIEPSSATVPSAGVTAGAAADPTADPTADAVPTDAVTAIRDVQRGQAVTLRGEVRRLRDTDEFILRDDTGAITVYIGWRNAMPVSVGQRVTVVGTADDDTPPEMKPEVYAARILFSDGRKVELIRSSRDE
jgi:uncharacterized protein YdeI (BOF family)